MKRLLLIGVVAPALAAASVPIETPRETIAQALARTSAEAKAAAARVAVLEKREQAASDEAAYMEERFGPISFIIATENTAESIALATRAARDKGALTCAVYSTDAAVLANTEEAAAHAGVALSCNLTGNVYVNQSAAFSDYHGTGANPAANAALTDSAFVASRFRVVQSRVHVQ